MGNTAVRRVATLAHDDAMNMQKRGACPFRPRATSVVALRLATTALRFQPLPLAGLPLSRFTRRGRKEYPLFIEFSSISPKFNIAIHNLTLFHVQGGDLVELYLHLQTNRNKIAFMLMPQRAFLSRLGNNMSFILFYIAGMRLYFLFIFIYLLST